MGNIIREDNNEKSGSWRLFLISQDPRRTGDLEIYKSGYVIGRDSRAADGVIVSNPKISRMHCRIDFGETGYYITDLQSSNGTTLNEETITPGKPHPLANADIISLAGTEFAVFLKYE